MFVLGPLKSAKCHKKWWNVDFFRFPWLDMVADAHVHSDPCVTCAEVLFDLECVQYGVIVAKISHFLVANDEL